MTPYPAKISGSCGPPEDDNSWDSPRHVRRRTRVFLRELDAEMALLGLPVNFHWDPDEKLWRLFAPHQKKMHESVDVEYVDLHFDGVVLTESERERLKALLHELLLKANKP